MRIGYARVSTDDQTLDLQRKMHLKRAKCRQSTRNTLAAKRLFAQNLMLVLNRCVKVTLWSFGDWTDLVAVSADPIHLTTELRSRVLISSR